MIKIALSILLSVLHVQALKLAVINDIHLNPNLEDSCSLWPPQLCYTLGVYGTDTPVPLFEAILENIKGQHENPDAILISGDFVVHGLASKNHTYNNWSEMKIIINQALSMIQAHFPDTPILPNIGNNDVLHHYQAPNSTEKAMYYGDLYDIWFSEVLANKQNTTKIL